MTAASFSTFSVYNTAIPEVLFKYVGAYSVKQNVLHNTDLQPSSNQMTPFPS